MYNVLVWDNGMEEALVEVVVDDKVVYSKITFNLFAVLDWVYNNYSDANCETVKVIYK